MSEKKPEEPKPHRCVVDFWHRGMRADLHEQRYRRDRYSRPSRISFGRLHYSTSMILSIRVPTSVAPPALTVTTRIEPLFANSK